MQELRIRLPELHEAQQRVDSEQARFNVLACGVRWGKSTFGMDRLVHPAIQGFPVAWFAPTNKNLNESWELAKKTFLPLTQRKLEDKHIIELKTGGKVEMWSLEEPDACRGRKYKLAVIDEAAQVKRLEYAFTQVIRQRLTDFQGGAWFLSTPRGVDYFHSLFQRGADPLEREWRSWQMPTVTNPFIQPSEVEAARSDMSDLAFAQEYLAQFVTWEGAVFRKIRDAIEDAYEAAPNPEDSYVIGCDWGQMNDYNVFLVLNATTMQVVEIDRSRGQEYRLQRGRLAALREKWSYRSGNPPLVRRQPSVIAEVNSMGQPIIEEIRAGGIPVTAFETNNASKSEIILDLALAFEQGAIHIPSDPVLLGELQQFQGKRLAGGLMRYEAPSGQHDDTVIALAIAYRMAKRDTVHRTPLIVQQLTRESPWHDHYASEEDARW